MVKQIGTSDLQDTWAAEGIVVEPSDPKKANGWDLGEQPPHEYMNWIQNLVMKTINYILKSGVTDWNADTEYGEGDFCKRAGILYTALSDNSNSQPPSANWKPIGPVPARYSIRTADNGMYELVNDVETPGNKKYYGTDASGARGWFVLATDSFVTGDIKFRYDTAEHAGFVRMNGLTIGNAASGATERANDDTEALFLYLHAKDPNLTVSGGRGASAAADWAANKRITTPDWRARAAACVDGFGNANSNRVTASGTGNPNVNSSVLGAAGGLDRIVLIEAQLAKHQHYTPNRPTVILTEGGPNYSIGNNTLGNNPSSSFPNGPTYSSIAGNDEAHPNLQPTAFAGFYIKL